MGYSEKHYSPFKELYLPHHLACRSVRWQATGGTEAYLPGKRKSEINSFKCKDSLAKILNLAQFCLFHGFQKRIEAFPV